MRTQAFDEMHEADLARIGSAFARQTEHAFTEKRASDGDTVETSNESPVAPRLDRVRVTVSVKQFIRPLKERRDPGAILFAAVVCAARNDIAEVRIDGHSKPSAPHTAPQRVADAKCANLKGNQRAWIAGVKAKRSFVRIAHRKRPVAITIENDRNQILGSDALHGGLAHPVRDRAPRKPPMKRAADACNGGMIR